jgi:MoaA/NifB/PqqE/SkfB family radical SAM enzyme
LRAVHENVLARAAVPQDSMSEFGWKYLTRDDKSALLRGIRSGRAEAGPFHIEFHPADRCNIDCFFCSTAAIRGTDELPQQRFEELIDEARAAGTRSFRLSGGGEPLFHRRIKPVLRRIRDAGIPIENLTTNAVLLDEETSDLLTDCCDQVTISLNTGDAASYASMMKTTERNFERVLKNVRTLASVKKQKNTERPKITLQFLIWRDNYRSIPQMYDLAMECGADDILFNGLSFLAPDQLMTSEQRAEMLSLYEQVIRRDEFRHIANIASFEQSIAEEMEALIAKLAAERRGRGIVRRAIDFAKRDEPLASRIRHFLKMRSSVKASQAANDVDDACIIGWYSLVVRSTGEVAPCCILQGRSLGIVMQQPLADVWSGERFDALRGELSEIIRKRNEWSPDGSEQIVDAGCGLSGTCPMRSYYYRRDHEFAAALTGAR